MTVRTPFYKRDNCGAFVDYYRGGFRTLCKHCGEDTLLPMKELYVVNTEREKETMDDALRTLHCEPESKQIRKVHVCHFL